LPTLRSLVLPRRKQGVDARDKPAHDDAVAARKKS
jgi:hypothetical protein